MKLSQINNNNSNDNKKHNTKQETQETPSISLDELIAMSDTANAWWKRSIGAELKNVDVVKIEYRDKDYDGTPLTNQDGSARFDIVLTMLTPKGYRRLFRFPMFKDAYKAISKALNPNNEDGIIFTNILGKNITLKVTGKNGNAYTHECVINADANHEVDGIYGVNGEKKEEE